MQVVPETGRVHVYIIYFSVTEALPTANFPNMECGETCFDLIKKWSPSFPLMVTEFWTGWFDHWTSTHKGLSLDGMRLECITESIYILNIFMLLMTLIQLI